MTGEITYVGFGAEDQTPHAWVDVQCEFWAYCHGEERFSYALVERPQADSKPKEGARARIDVEGPQSEVTKSGLKKLYNPTKATKHPA